MPGHLWDAVISLNKMFLLILGGALAINKNLWKIQDTKSCLKKKKKSRIRINLISSSGRAPGDVRSTSGQSAKYLWQNLTGDPF